MGGRLDGGVGAGAVVFSGCFVKAEWFFLLDVDGTLAPIARMPRQASIPSRARNVIRNLAKNKACAVALVSGRPVRELKRLLNVPGVILVGNHGFEFEGVNAPPLSQKAASYGRVIKRVACQLQETFTGVKGVLVEDKVWTLSVHFRNVRSGQLPVFQRKLEVIQRTKNGKMLSWQQGKKVWEARPPVRWDKGMAALYLLKKFGGYPIVMGDDRTDEDMFRAIAGKGLAIHVGNSRNTAASFKLRSPREAGLLLELLCQLRKPKNHLFSKLNLASRN
ncbi:MAG: trehalose-phosphatase [Candidatus Omnitrophica bacterium]|nr:trehalose-phosphatase [Candidatus Omnitrophota bacterium]